MAALVHSTSHPSARHAQADVSDTMKGRYLCVLKAPESMAQSLTERSRLSSQDASYWKSSARTLDVALRVLTVAAAAIALSALVAGVVVTVVVSHGAAIPVWFVLGGSVTTLLVAPLLGAICGFKEAPFNFLESWHRSSIHASGKTEFFAKRVRGMRHEYNELKHSTSAEVRRQLRALQVSLRGIDDSRLNEYLPALAAYNAANKMAAELKPALEQALESDRRAAREAKSLPGHVREEMLCLFQNVLQAKSDALFALSALKCPDLPAADRFADTATVSHSALADTSTPFITFKGGLSGRPITVAELMESKGLSWLDLSRRIIEAAPRR